MTLYPSSDDDGPVTVTLTDGTVETYDRLFNHQSGMVTFYDVERDGNRIRKGDRAVTLPVRRITQIDWGGFGGDR